MFGALDSGGSARRSTGPGRLLRAIAGIVALSTVAAVGLVAASAPGVAALAIGAETASHAVDRLPSTLPEGEIALPTTLYVKDPAGEGWTELARFFEQDRRPVGFDDVAPVVYDAIVSSEDPRFWKHHGIDALGTARAMAQNLRGGSAVQGGSSITQQYVKNLVIEQCVSDAKTGAGADACYAAATTSSGTAGIQRKLTEMKTALRLEQTTSKKEILTGYLNIVNFGGTTSGIEAAARRYFGVTAAELSLAQAAALVGVVQNPSRFRLDRPEGAVVIGGRALNGAPDGTVEKAGGGLDALTAMRDDGRISEEQYLRAADGYTQTKGRQLYVLGRMLEEGRITRAQYTEAALEPLTPVVTPAVSGCGAAAGRAYFCEYVRSALLRDPRLGVDEKSRARALSRSGMAVYTTLDPELQDAAEQAMTQRVPGAVSGVDLGAASVSTEVGTGRVLSMTQNTRFSGDPKVAVLPGYRSLVFATSATEVLGASDVSPLSLAVGFGAEVNFAPACEPSPIDRIVDRSGTMLVAGAAACPPMRSGAGYAHAAWGPSTSDLPASAIPEGDGTPVVGRRGLDGRSQSMIVESSSRVTTVVWVGNASGQADLTRISHGGTPLSDLRYPVAAAVQAAANRLYRGADFPLPFG